MRKALIAIVVLCMGTSESRAELFTNPAANIGKKNLSVGVEFSSVASVYDLDASELPITSERALLKVTAGLTDWLDIYLKGGGANLVIDYKEDDDDVVQNFAPDKMSAGFGAGTRIQILNRVNSGTRVFFQGGGFFFNADGEISSVTTTKTVTTSREMRWLDVYAGLGVSKRLDFLDITGGVGFSEIKWWMKDDVSTITGTSTSTVHKDWRSSFETRSPIVGFIGLDFVLPHEYRLSLQTGIRGMDAAEVTFAVSQGLEKD